MKVLVVDADPQGTATRWAASAADDDPFPASVVGLAAANTKVHREVQKFANDYDYIIIDCPPVGRLTSAAKRTPHHRCSACASYSFTPGPLGSNRHRKNH